MDPGRLTRDELMYELKVRGVKRIIGTSVASMRNRLRELLKEEHFAEFSVAEGVGLEVTSELGCCHDKVFALRQDVTRFLGSRAHPQYSRIVSCVSHVLGRISRITAVTEEDKATCEELVKVAHEVEDILEAGIEERASQKAEAASVETSHETQPVQRRQIPVSQWGLKFSGARDSWSISAFIERVEEIRGARNVSTGDLFDSAIDVFEGDALVWYRSVRDQVSTWSQLIGRLRAEFQPFDYEYELWNEIRGRVQGNGETVGMYFACMANLFARLPKSASDAEKLCVLRRNVDPYYIHGLGLTRTLTVQELLGACKILETNRNMAEVRSSRGLGTRSLEPDLAGPRTEPTNRKPVKVVAEVAAVAQAETCWNCKQIGHRFAKCTLPRTSLFCFRCGTPGVRREQCTKCSGNESRGPLKPGESPAPTQSR